MSDTDQQVSTEPTDLAREELRLLKQRATMMGITFSNNIGIESLKAKIEAKMSGNPMPQEPSEPAVNPLAQAAEIKAETRSLRQMVYDKNMHLVRLRIQNLDPKKKDLPGEILTVANQVLGTVSKYVPYNEVSDGGYHVPYCIYKMMLRRQFQNITVTKDPRTGRERIKYSMAKEFALEVLPPLTPAEIKNLAQAQLAAGSLDAA
jgi:hypothetical protein